MDGKELYELTRRAIEIASSPCWPASDDSEMQEMLVWLPGVEPDQSAWILTRTNDPSGAFPSPSDDDLFIEPAMASALITEHLRQFLAVRGWQVQAHVRRDSTTWRLVDCLAAADGGGDRLDSDYPRGTNEREVICQSVIAVQTDIRRR